MPNHLKKLENESKHASNHYAPRKNVVRKRCGNELISIINAEYIKQQFFSVGEYVFVDNVPFKSFQDYTVDVMSRRARNNL